MDSTEQEAVDDLLGDIESAADAPEAASASQDVSSDQDTSESSDGQPSEASEPAVNSEQMAIAGNPNGRPWVDFIPKDIRPKPQNLAGWLDRAIDDRNYKLKEAEFLSSKQVFGVTPNASYVNTWVNDTNSHLRLSVRLKTRKKRYEQLGYISAETSDHPEEAESVEKNSSEEEKSMETPLEKAE